MTTKIKGQSEWRIHAVVYLLVATLLFLWALPVNWDTPTNLRAYDAWVPLAGIVATASLVFGSIQGLLLARGVQLGALLACLFAAAFVFMSMGIFLDGPIANGDRVWTAGREQVVVPQLLWAWYWAVHTGVVASWLRLQRSAHARTGTEVSPHPIKASR